MIKSPSSGGKRIGFLFDYTLTVRFFRSKKKKTKNTGNDFFFFEI